MKRKSTFRPLDGPFLQHGRQSIFEPLVLNKQFEVHYKLCVIKFLYVKTTLINILLYKLVENYSNFATNKKITKINYFVNI